MIFTLIAYGENPLKVLYILNDSLFYKRMTIFSLSSLRKYEPDLEVEVLLVEDGGINSRDVLGYNTYDWGLGHIGHEEFVKFCKNINVKVVPVQFDNGEETFFDNYEEAEEFLETLNA